MNGIHDLGGMDGFGAVDVETNEPVFHASWERTVFGITTAVFLARIGNAHAYRHAIERMEPGHYLAAPYYERMLTGIATMLVDRGVVSRADLDARVPGGFPLGRPVAPEPLRGVGIAGAGIAMDAPTGVGTAPGTAATAGARFAIGDAVVVRNVQTHGHTRCPRYVRGKRGVVVRVDRAFSLPDIEAHSDDLRKEPTYGVRFAAAELWGTAGGVRETMTVDLWESYLDAAATEEPRSSVEASVPEVPR